VIPADPTLASNSAAIISRQVTAVAANSEVKVTWSGWSHPVYYVGSAQSKNTYIRMHLDGGPASGGATQCGPLRWRSCITGNFESDGHATVVDEVDGCVYEFWMLNKNIGIADPETGGASGMPFTDTTAVKEPLEGTTSNAGGALVYASSVWPDECSTSFNHGFMFGAPWSVNNPSKTSEPFYHCDGSGTHADDLFQGMRVQLNPAYDISGLPTYKRSVAQALKTYGMYDGNSNGGNWSIYGISKQGYSNNPWIGVVPDPNATSFNVVPVEQFRVLAPTWTTLKIYRTNNSCISYQGAPAPTLSSVSPNSGGTSGGTVVTLTGTKLEGTTNVSFGGTSATNVTVLGGTSVKCTSPAGSGSVSVTVAALGGTSNGVTFTYSGGTPPPTLTAINPTSGPTSGGTACTLTGTSLTGCSAVSFGGTAASGISVVSSTQVRCTSPAKSAATYSVTATTGGGTSNGVNYTYTSGGPSYTTTLNPVADAWFKTEKPNNNYGTSTLIHCQKNATFEKQSYLKFNLSSVSGAAITSATLRMYLSVSSLGATVKAYSCADDSWTETGITWNNKPAAGTQQASCTNINAINQWYDWNLTSYIGAEFAGDKVVSVVIRDDLSQNKDTEWRSREYAGYSPQLVVISE